jgi:diacylglycerol kinase
VKSAGAKMNPTPKGIVDRHPNIEFILPKWNAGHTSPTPMSRRFELSGRVKSIGHAIDGIFYVLRSQHNAWIHAAGTVVVVAAGLFFQVGAGEWCWIVIAATSVWTAEALNTALELLADAATKEIHPLIGHAKDVAAGAVLVTAIGASVIGVIIFWPHLYLWLGANPEPS